MAESDSRLVPEGLFLSEALFCVQNKTSVEKIRFSKWKTLIEFRVFFTTGRYNVSETMGIEPGAGIVAIETRGYFLSPAECRIFLYFL